MEGNLGRERVLYKEGESEGEWVGCMWGWGWRGEWWRNLVDWLVIGRC